MVAAWSYTSEKLNGNGHVGPLQSDGLLIIGEPAEDERLIPRRDFIVPRYIQRGVVTEVLGPGGNGKSLLFLAWAISMALGLPYGDFVPIRAMRVISYDVEDDIDEQQSRCAAILRSFGRHAADLNGHLLLMTPAGVGTLFEFEDGRVAKRSRLAERLDSAIDEFQPDVVLLNPLAEIHDAQENDNGLLRIVMSEVRTMARQYGIAIIVGHHTRKGPSDPGNPDAGRGASSIGGVVRKSFTLFKMTKEEAEKLKLKQHCHYFRLDGAKANYGALNDTNWFEITAHTLDNGDIAPAPWPWIPPRDIITADVLADLLGQVAIGNGDEPWSPTIGSYNRSFSRLCERYGIATAEGQKEALRRLSEAGVQQLSYTTHQRNAAKGLRHPDGRPNVPWKPQA